MSEHAAAKLLAEQLSGQHIDRIVRFVTGTWLPIEPDEWIIRDAVQPALGLVTRYYPCKPDVFAATYEAVTE